MTLAACLALYGVLVAVAAPRMLGRRTAMEDAPRLGVACWLFAVASVVVAWLTAAMLVVIEAVMVEGHLDAAVTICVAVLRATGLSEEGLWLVAVAVAAVPVAAVVLGAWRFGRLTRSARLAGRRHADAVRLVGRATPHLGRRTVVLDVPQCAAYCLSGNRGTIVVTTAAVASLSEQELRAVLAHERAHLTGHHHAVLTVLTGLRRTLGALPLFAHAEHVVSRLLEMSADDAAVRRHGRDPLLAALLNLSGVTVPRHSLGASSVGVLARAGRLLEPPTAAQRATTQRSLTVTLAAMLLGPALTFGTMAMTVCPTMWG